MFPALEHSFHLQTRIEGTNLGMLSTKLFRENIQEMKTITILTVMQYYSACGFVLNPPAEQ